MLVEQPLCVLHGAAAFLGPPQRDLEDIVDAVFLQISAIVDREIEDVRLYAVHLDGVLDLGGLLPGDGPSRGDLVFLIEVAQPLVYEPLIHDIVKVRVIDRYMQRNFDVVLSRRRECLFRFFGLRHLSVEGIYLIEEDDLPYFFSVLIPARGSLNQAS